MSSQNKGLNYFRAVETQTEDEATHFNKLV